MSLATPPSSVPHHPEPLRWSGETFDRAVTAGIFDGLRVELIAGQVLEMPPMNEAHASAVQLGTYALLRTFPSDRFTVRVQLPLILGEARPLPDFVILNGPPRQNLQNPSTALLVIEVSDTTLDFDRDDKALLYAQHGLLEYWIVNLGARSVEVRRRPQLHGNGDASYAETIIFAEDQIVTPLSAADCTIKVADLLP